MLNKPKPKTTIQAKLIDQFYPDPDDVFSGYEEDWSSDFTFTGKWKVVTECTEDNSEMVSGLYLEIQYLTYREQYESRPCFFGWWSCIRVEYIKNNVRTEWKHEDDFLIKDECPIMTCLGKPNDD